MAGKDQEVAPKRNGLIPSSTTSILLASTPPMLPRWFLTDHSGRCLLADCQRSNPSKALKSSKSSHVFAVPVKCHAHHGEFHNNVYDPKQRRPPEGRFCRDCLFLTAINALPRVLSPRLGLLVWFDLTPKFFGLPDSPLAHYFCIADESPNNQQLWQYGSSSLAKQSHCPCGPFYFYIPRMCMVVFFRENVLVVILAAGSQRFFWAAWTVMKNCRSQFAWQCAQLLNYRSTGCWCRRCFVYRRWYRGCNVNCLAIALGSFVFARCGGYEKAVDVTRAGNRLVQSTLLFSFTFWSTGGADVYLTVYPTDI